MKSILNVKFSTDWQLDEGALKTSNFNHSALDWNIICGLQIVWWNDLLNKEVKSSLVDHKALSYCTTTKLNAVRIIAFCCAFVLFFFSAFAVSYLERWWK